MALLTLLVVAVFRPPLLKPGFLLFAAITTLFGAVLLGPDPFSPSISGALAGLTIVARGAILLTVARWVAEGASAFELARLGSRFGAGWLGFALGVAINALPDLSLSARRVYDAFRMRGGRPRDFRLLAAAILSNAFSRADAQADVAQARGFRLDLPPEPGPPWSRGMLAAVAGGWVVALAAALFSFG